MTGQIISIPLSRLTTGSLSSFHNGICSFIEKTTPAALHIESQYPAYKTAAGTLASIVRRRTAFVSTQMLQEADRRRDNACGTIINVVKDYGSSLVDEKREASKILLPQLSPYKGIGRHEYSKQSAELRGMLSVLNAEANLPYVKALGLTADVEALRAASEAFDQAFEQRTTEMTERLPERNLGTAQVTAEANQRYEEIVRIVNAYAIVSPTEEIRDFIASANGHIAVYKRIQGSPTGGSSSGSDLPTEPEQPTEPGQGDSESPDEI